MFTVIIDTNIIFSDFSLEGETFTTLFCALDYLRAKIRIPRIVIEEILVLHREQLIRAQRDIERESRRYSNLTAKTLTVNFDDIDEECNAYSKRLENILKLKGIEILEYDHMKANTISVRALRRRRPFDEKGHNGWRDSIIWEVVLEFLSKSDDQVIFITQNTKDFADKDKKHELHPHLKEDLRLAHLDDKRFEFVTDLEVFRSAYIDKYLRIDYDILKQGKLKAIEGLNLEKLTANEFVDTIKESDLERKVAQIVAPRSLSGSIKHVETESVEIKDVQVLSDTNELLVTCQADVYCYLDILNFGSFESESINRFVIIPFQFVYNKARREFRNISILNAFVTQKYK